jgi:ubiquitin carboxyl-terminal hydrolase 20/33
LKRFRHDTYFSSKITTYVQFPLEGLDMMPYCTTTHANSNTSLGSEKNYVGVTNYDLYAMIHHRGGLGGMYILSLYSCQHNNDF